MSNALPLTDDTRQLLSHRATLRSEGYLLLRDVVRQDAFKAFEAFLLRELGERLVEPKAIRQARVTALLEDDPDTRERFYERVKELGGLANFAASVASSITESFPIGPVIQSLTRCRMDLPMDVREYAIWHQDVYYTKRPDALTIWVPLQDMRDELGPLKVMPKTHKLGALKHFKSPRSKRFFVPCASHSAEVRYVDMCKGDALLFDAHLLHSSSLNHSLRTRFSVQIRCERAATP